MGLVGALSVSFAIWWWLGTRVPSRLSRLAINDQRRAREASPVPPDSREDRSRLVSQAPLIADLLSTAVSAGASVFDALAVVAEAVDDPARSRLVRVGTAIELGAPPEIAWGELLDDESLAPIADAAIRSLHTGAPLAFVLDAAAVDMRQAHRAEVTEAARSAGVRTVAPLALCFLPAYLLVGVVPIIAGFASTMFG